MDHLPLILGHRDLLPRVQCECDPESFDGGEFESFPTRKGFNLIFQHEWPKFVLNADGSRLDAGALAGLVQAWLFFGLLIEVLKVSGVSIDVEDLLHREGDDAFITTRSLPKYLAEWESKEILLPEKVRKIHFRRQQHMIMISNHFRLHQISGQWWQDTLLQWIERPVESYVVALPLPLQMSISILCDTLDRASRRARGILKSVQFEPMLQNSNLMLKLRDAAWCPSDIAFVLQGLDDTSAFFVSQMKRQRLDADHSKCSNNKCLAFNISTERYETRHDADCQGCQDLYIDRQGLASMLQRGQTPRAWLQLPGTPSASPIDLSIRESGPYITISHVWSDGLGNPRANSLPACQLLRLYRMAVALDVSLVNQGSAIWIDSLLVPVEKGPEKRLALTRLSDYYQNAEMVLVLDSDLLNASRRFTNEELTARVLFSTWMRRLWTLEEGILSGGNLMFQLRDGTVSLNNLLHCSNFTNSITTVATHLMVNLQIFLPSLSASHHYPAEGDQLESRIFAKLLPALEYRSTTKAADEPLCIAHILGLDASRLVAIDDSELRMKELIGILANWHCLFPRNLLFTQEPKLQFEGFRWCSASLMAFEREDIEYLVQCPDKHHTKLIKEGLLIQGIGGFTLPFGNETFKKVTYADADKRIYALSPVPIGQSCRDGTYWTAESLKEALNVDTASWHAEMQEILGQSPNNLAILFDGADAILVSIYKSEGQKSSSEGSLIFVRIISQIYKRQLKIESANPIFAGADSSALAFGQPSGYVDEMERQMREAFEKIYDPKTSTFLHCISIDPSQRWCIG